MQTQLQAFSSTTASLRKAIEKIASINTQLR